MEIQEPLHSLTAEEMDLLREIGSQSGAFAADSLSKLMKAKVLIDVPSVHVVPLREIPTLLGDREKPVVAVSATLQGDIDGLYTVIFTFDNARTLCGLFDSTPVQELLAISEIQRSSLLEIVNIIMGSFTVPLANILKLRVLFSVPCLSIDMVGAILQSIALTYASVNDDTVLGFDIQLTESIQGHILMTTNVEGSRIILSKIKDSFIRKASL